jgi:hypothetical protein
VGARQGGGKSCPSRRNAQHPSFNSAVWSVTHCYPLPCNDEGRKVAFDGSGNAYVAGYTASDETTFPVLVGPDVTYNGGNYDGFVAKINSSGTGLTYGGYLGAHTRSLASSETITILPVFFTEARIAAYTRVTRYTSNTRASFISAISTATPAGKFSIMALRHLPWLSWLWPP